MNENVSDISRYLMIAEWVVAVGTLLVAGVAVFQETIRGWFYQPKLRVSIKTEPPDCVSVPFTTAEGAFLLTAFYLRLWVENVGNTTARQVEVYAKELRRKLADGRWQRVDAFPPMNLKWSDVGGLYFARIAAKMGKHCDLGHIVDPARRSVINENAARLALNDQQTSLTFDLIAQPNHKGHIIGPGEYELDLLVAADNARPSSHTVTISLPGRWYEDETRMLRDGVGVAVKSEATFNVNY